jgi:hypothetical protein
MRRNAVGVRTFLSLRVATQRFEGDLNQVPSDVRGHDGFECLISRMGTPDGPSATATGKSGTLGTKKRHVEKTGNRPHSLSVSWLVGRSPYPN